MMLCCVEREHEPSLYLTRGKIPSVRKSWAAQRLRMVNSRLTLADVPDRCSSIRRPACPSLIHKLAPLPPRAALLLSPSIRARLFFLFCSIRIPRILALPIRTGLHSREPCPSEGPVCVRKDHRSGVEAHRGQQGALPVCAGCCGGGRV